MINSMPVTLEHLSRASGQTREIWLVSSTFEFPNGNYG